MTDTMQYDVVIIGAGAAGMMCAIEAGKRGRSVLLVDHAKKAGEKIRISGGGRCNFTNLHCSPKQFLSQNPHFCVSALRRYSQHDFVAMVEAHGIAYHEKTLGQLFCDDSSKQIINMLLEECHAADVDIQLNTSVETVKKPEEQFTLKLSDARMVSAESVVIATGGPSIPKMGATGWGYKIAEQFGLNIIETRPALVPFTLSPKALEENKALAGVALPVRASNDRTSFDEAMLFTHRGLSGPAVLQISSYWRDGEEVSFNLMPDMEALAELKVARDAHPKQALHTVLAKWLPKALAQHVCAEQIRNTRMADLSNAVLKEVADTLNGLRITPNGTEGYRTAEVTLGGVDTDELSSKTFEAKRVQGLYFIGEVVDVTGWLGGYNFQWAWASGHCAGQYV